VLELTIHFQTPELKSPVFCKVGRCHREICVSISALTPVKKMTFDRRVENMNMTSASIFSKYLNKKFATFADNTLPFLSTLFLLQASASVLLLISTRYGHSLSSWFWWRSTEYRRVYIPRPTYKMASSTLYDM